MTPVNQNWPSFQHLGRESDHVKKIEEVLAKADFAYLCSKAIEYRENKENKPSLQCSVDTTRFTSGAFNVVVALDFSDSVQWIARILLSQSTANDSDDESLSASLLSEVATMKLVREKTKIPVPLVFGYEVSKNPLGYSYVLMEALPGNVLPSRFATSVPNEYKKKIGRISHSGESDPNDVESLRVFPFPMTGYLANVGPFSTSLEYFYHFRKGQTRSLLEEHRGEAEWEAALWLLETAVTSMATEEFVNGPFPLCHLDLHFNNMLFDDEFNLTGIIDWSYAQTVPVERFVVSPEFIAPPAAPAAVKQSIFDFRGMFIDAWRAIGNNKSSQQDLTLYPSKLVASPVAELVYRCTCSYPWRAIFDARLSLRLLYGENAKWEEFQKFNVEKSTWK
ncbi:uncharacterized protein TRUGW13939_01520 [Talaromyces rugulosus]|uniref:Aminoglycoside phosphotransferase domain-containing protein n=1 Tax=Talaromyces rugulosus TaxID=121627 RepID=A0A7H8QKN4_TALRU|nr:uncharacterized protein TRUGW13939_01520 [Talaromyces rugulosus]QKX54434.1 hypothetical protein TRUGW13939_01520 [Talaromyces rugulosus]